MKFADEFELQAAITYWLQSKGHNVQREVHCGGGRVDILTDEHLIEVKPYLTRDAQFQALGQLQTYDNEYPDHQKVIAGLLPTNNKPALSTANRIEGEGVHVWFMDQDADFVQFCDRGAVKAHQRVPQWQVFAGVACIVVGLILLF